MTSGFAAIAERCIVVRYSAQGGPSGGGGNGAHRPRLQRRQDRGRAGTCRPAGRHPGVGGRARPPARLPNDDADYWTARADYFGQRGVLAAGDARIQLAAWDAAVDDARTADELILLVRPRPRRPALALFVRRLGSPAAVCRPQLTVVSIDRHRRRPLTSPRCAAARPRAAGGAVAAAGRRCRATRIDEAIAAWVAVTAADPRALPLLYRRVRAMPFLGRRDRAAISRSSRPGQRAVPHRATGARRDRAHRARRRRGGAHRSTRAIRSTTRSSAHAVAELGRAGLGRRTRPSRRSAARRSPARSIASTRPGSTTGAVASGSPGTARCGAGRVASGGSWSADVAALADRATPAPPARDATPRLVAGATRASRSAPTPGSTTRSARDSATSSRCSSARSCGRAAAAHRS